MNILDSQRIVELHTKPSPFKFSFLMAIPVISGAGFLTFIDSYNNFSIPISIGFAALFSSFLVGVIALKWLLNWLG